jgi:SAM-dependent methyltransferase
MSETMVWTGIAAETWDAGGGDDPQWDHDFFRQVLAENPGRALDIGCGTGRLLVRFLSYAFDVEGLELSPDMLAICRRKAEAKGLTPVVYLQDMRTMALPNKYRVIFIPCGSFMLVLDDEEAKGTMRRFYEHLEPGGILAFTMFDMFGPDQDIKIGEWVSRWRDPLPDGTELEVLFYTDSINRVEQVYRGRRHYKVWLGDQVVREQFLEDTFRWYSVNELRLLLELSGFELLSMKGNKLDEEVNETHWGLAVVARKR